MAQKEKFHGNRKMLDNLSYVERALLLGFLTIALMVSLGFYIYYVGMSVLYIVERGGIERETSSLLSRVAFLEETHIRLSKSVLPKYAHISGFVAPERVSYVSTRTFTAYADDQNGGR